MLLVALCANRWRAKKAKEAKEAKKAAEVDEAPRNAEEARVTAVAQAEIDELTRKAAAARREAEEVKMAAAAQAEIKAAAEERAAGHTPLITGILSGNEAAKACKKVSPLTEPVIGYARPL